MRTTHPSSAPATVQGLLVLGRGGHIHEGHPAARAVVADPALRSALVAAARGLVPGGAWDYQVVRAGSTTLRVRLQRERRTGRVYALVALEQPPRDGLDLAGLTPRELQVVQLVAEGRFDARSARRLGLSPKTLRWHLGNVLRKTGLASRDALRQALEPARPTPRRAARPAPTPPAPCASARARRPSSAPRARAGAR